MDLPTQFDTITELLGSRLRQLRIQHDETQARFAERLGISRQTYAKLEAGNPTTPIGLWVKASQLLNRTDDWDALLKEKANLFEQYDRRQQSQRQRVSHRGPQR